MINQARISQTNEKKIRSKFGEEVFIVKRIMLAFQVVQTKTPIIL